MKFSSWKFWAVLAAGVVAALLVFLVLRPHNQTGDFFSTWHEFESPADGFAVKFPDIPPEMSTSTVEYYGADSPVPIISYYDKFMVAETGQLYFASVEVETFKRDVTDEDAKLDASHVMGMYKKSKLLSSRTATVDGYPAGEIFCIFEDEDTKSVARVLFIRKANRIYTLQLAQNVETAGEFDEDLYKKFADSFSFK